MRKETTMTNQRKCPVVWVQITPSLRWFPGPAASALVLCILPLAVSLTSASDWPQWRGPNRNGLSEEKGFVKEWPKTGPELVWRASDLGRGYSTPAVVGDRLYVMGSEGTDKEFVEALSAKDGKKLWSTQLGPVGN